MGVGSGSGGIKYIMRRLGKHDHLSPKFGWGGVGRGRGYLHIMKRWISMIKSYFRTFLGEHG